LIPGCSFTKAFLQSGALKTLFPSTGNFMQELLMTKKYLCRVAANTLGITFVE